MKRKYCLTVRQLIARLKKMPPESLVVWQDHDQESHEINGYVGDVWEAEPKLLTKENETHLVILRA